MTLTQDYIFFTPHLLTPGLQQLRAVHIRGCEEYQAQYVTCRDFALYCGIYTKWKLGEEDNHVWNIAADWEVLLLSLVI